MSYTAPDFADDAALALQDAGYEVRILVDDKSRSIGGNAGCYAAKVPKDPNSSIAPWTGPERESELEALNDALEHMARNVARADFDAAVADNGDCRLNAVKRARQAAIDLRAAIQEAHADAEPLMHLLLLPLISDAAVIENQLGAIETAMQVAP